ncbi:MAG TPA: hypothetical protein VK177_21015 [Flavobacteriales bacterium]|nr:hypothetical protein [Flavobacteriales bacterium]
MKAIIGVYTDHTMAVEALKALEKHFFPLKKVSVKEKTETLENNIRVMIHRGKELIPILTGVTICCLIGLMVGSGVITIPALMSLNGSGFLIGGMAGLMAGIIICGFISLLITVLKKRDRKTLNSDIHIKHGKYEVIVEGTTSDIDRAEKILLKEYLDTNVPPGL